MSETTEIVILNFDCQWCGQPFRAMSRPVVPCPFCKSEHGPENGHLETDDEREDAAYWASVDRENADRWYAEETY